MIRNATHRILCERALKSNALIWPTLNAELLQAVLISAVSVRYILKVLFCWQLTPFFSGFAITDGCLCNENLNVRTRICEVNLNLCAGHRPKSWHSTTPTRTPTATPTRQTRLQSYILHTLFPREAVFGESVSVSASVSASWNASNTRLGV